MNLPLKDVKVGSLFVFVRKLRGIWKAKKKLTFQHLYTTIQKLTFQQLVLGGYYAEPI